MKLPTIAPERMPRLAYAHGSRHDPMLTGPEKFRTVVNSSHHVKPGAGGLWTSPVTREDPAGTITSTAWTEWCLSEGFGLHRYRYFLEIQPNPDARVLHVNRLGDLAALQTVYALGVREPLVGLMHWAVLDWERMAADGWDAVFLTDRGEHETRFPEEDGGPCWYGWDAATVFWMRPSYKVVTP